MNFGNIVPLSIVDLVVKYKLKNVAGFERFLAHHDPDVLEELGKRKVIQTFKRVAAQVPAYQALLKKHKVKIAGIQDAEDLKKLPIIDKKSYIRTSTRLKDLCMDGTLAHMDMIVQSSGFSGKPTTWIRSKQEEEEAKKMALFQMELMFHLSKKRTLILDCFSLGSWVSGIDFFRLMSGAHAIATPGWNIKQTVSLMKAMKDDFDQFLIAGTPTFLTMLAEKGARHVNWKNYNIRIMTGAEGFSEGWREYMHQVFKQPAKQMIYSVFAATDLGVTGASETDYTIQIRKFAQKDKEFCLEAFGSETPPMLFQYDPTTYYVETNKKQELIFTTCRDHALMPLVRYNLHDTGGTLTYKHMKKLLGEHGKHFDLHFPLPFLFIRGRSDGIIYLGGTAISPNVVQQIIYKNKALKQNLTHRFRMFVEEKKGKKSWHIHFQLKKGKKKNALLPLDVAEYIQEGLYHLNEDLRTTIKFMRKHGKKRIFKVTIFPFKKYPYKDGVKVQHIGRRNHAQD